MKNEYMFVIGILLTPLTLLIILVFGGLIDATTSWIELFRDFFFYIYPISLIGVILYGIPCCLILKYFGYLNYITLASAGFMGGAAIGTQATPIMGSTLLYGSFGILSATGFWFFIIYIPNKLSIKKNH